MCASGLVLNRLLHLTIAISMLLVAGFDLTEDVSAEPAQVKTITLDTDSSWKSLDVEVRGWTTVGFDDSWWEDAEQMFQLDNFGRAFAIWHPGSPKPTSAYFRKSLLLEGDEVISGRIYLQVYSYNAGVKHNAYVYINDEYLDVVGGHWSWRYGVGYSKELYITDHLKKGQNTIAIKVEATQPGSRKYYWGLTGQVQYATGKLVDHESSSSHPSTDLSSDQPSHPWWPYVHLYGQVTDVAVGEEIIAYLSTVNPITSPGTLSVQLTLLIPSGWSVSGSEFVHGAGGLWVNTYSIAQGANPKAINLSILANEPYEGPITGYIDYYFDEDGSKYRDEITLLVRALSEPHGSQAISESDSTTSDSGAHPRLIWVVAIMGLVILVLMILLIKLR